MKFDCLVLGAGIIGVATALHLQKRGRFCALVDRRPAAEETSYGNTGLIQSEAVLPYAFPRNIRAILTAATNSGTDAHLHYSALPRIAPWLISYWRHGSKHHVDRTARAALPLLERCLSEHELLMREAGIVDMLRRTGYIKLHRHQNTLDLDVAEQEMARDRFGVQFEVVDDRGLRDLEPHLIGEFAGAVHMVDPVSVDDPSAVGKAYAQLFQSNGGLFQTADARTLEAVSGGWQVQTVNGPIVAQDCIIALGPWSGEILKQLGVRVPLGTKRGYHMHYKASGNASLSRPVLDSDYGYVLTPMRQGIRLTTGAEFARMSAPKTPVQLNRVEPIAKKLFPLVDRTERQAWLGNRPCLPDMLPMIGGIPGHPGLWANFGHQHHGFTLAAVTGRLITEILSDEPTFCDVQPYRVDRFW
ncbi:MAG: NAD(P)/FAD-dependent oxidoreductase [Hyphomicrobiaceae bacterium]